MERRNFLKKVGLGLIFSSLPVKSLEKKDVIKYSFDDIFYRPYKGNQNLIYVKDNSILADKIYATGNVDKDYTAESYTGIYFPVRSIFIELKDEYSEEDFKHIIFYLKNKNKFSWKFIPFDNWQIGRSPMRFILNKEGYLQAEFFSKNNW